MKMAMKMANGKRVLSLMLALVIGLGGLGFFSFACGSKNPKAKPDRVLNRSIKKRPDWVYKKPRYIKKKYLYVSGHAVIRGDQALSQGMLGAELDAKARLAAEISQRLGRQIQSAAEGFDLDNQTIRSLTNMAVARDHVSGAFIHKTYWEKVAYYSDYSPDLEQTRYDCFTLAAIPLTELKKQVNLAWREYEDKRRGKDEVTPQLRQRFEDRWEEFFTSNL